MTTYHLTIRPAWSENVPRGFSSLSPEPKPFGSVTYAEPLPRDVAEHFSLRPADVDIDAALAAKVRIHDDEWALYEAFGDFRGPEWADLLYEVRTAQRPVQDFWAAVEAKCADYGTTLVVLDPASLGLMGPERPLDAPYSPAPGQEA
jgi:hypothetical protein